MKGVHVRVAGAGVVGLCVALELQTRGAEVELVDEAGAAKASAVAAGMIAPAFEAALEEPGEGRLPLLRAGRDLWPEVADGAVRLFRDGALAVARSGEAAQLAEAARALRAEGGDCEPLTPEALHRSCPWLAPDLAGGLFSAEDWRLDPVETLGLLEGVFLRRGGRRTLGRAEPGGLRSGVDAAVVCAGWGGRAFAGEAPELARLQPIKGQLVRFPGAPPHGGPTVRGLAGGYLAPGALGVAAGASMEAGRYDEAVRPEIQEAMVRRAASLAPHLHGAPAVGAAGVRASTPDGLPLIGASRTGVHLAAGFRRNGWLLAPLAARILADQLAGGDPGPWAEAMRPDRFG